MIQNYQQAKQMSGISGPMRNRQNRSYAESLMERTDEDSYEESEEDPQD